MKKMLLFLRYDGTNYHGWQVQPDAVTIQQKVQDAIEKVTGVRAGVSGCSRTDAGVHARMYACAFETESKITAFKFPLALNAYLPRDIVVYKCSEVPLDFHPRYHAVAKKYCYRFLADRHSNPFWDRYTHQVYVKMDVDKMNEASKLFIGTHDFSAFCSVKSDKDDNTRTIFESEVVVSDAIYNSGEIISFNVKGDGFLYNMVRIMAGTLLEVGKSNIQSVDIASIIEKRNRENAGKTLPAKGLMLDEVFYDINYWTDKYNVNGGLFFGKKE